jgi:hypothetical protein
MRLFLDALKEEHDIFKKVYVKAEQERQAIAEMDLDRLKVIIHEKQALLDRSSVIEGRIGDLRKVWQEAKDFIREELSQEIESFIEEFSAFMKKLVEFERNNEQIFMDKHKITESELDQLRLAKKASKAYFDKPHNSTGQTDIIG